jgi:hypothetical protein
MQTNIRWRGRWTRFSDWWNKRRPDASDRVEDLPGHLGILDGSSPPTAIRRRRHKSSACEEIEVLPVIFYRDYFVTKSIMNKFG